jgi:predicted nucleic acid-binding protein
MLPFLLDTCVVSEATKLRPNPAVMDFLEMADEYYIPAAVLFEAQAGIASIAASDPAKAARLSNWYCKPLKLPIIEPTIDILEIWGRLEGDRRLNGLRLPRTGANTLRSSQDIHIAAVAIARGAAIATMNVKDFLMIDKHHPLPGIYNPREQKWYARCF